MRVQLLTVKRELGLDEPDLDPALELHAAAHRTRRWPAPAPAQPCATPPCTVVLDLVILLCDSSTSRSPRCFCLRSRSVPSGRAGRSSAYRARCPGPGRRPASTGRWPHPSSGALSFSNSVSSRSSRFRSSSFDSASLIASSGRSEQSGRSAYPADPVTQLHPQIDQSSGGLRPHLGEHVLLGEQDSLAINLFWHLIKSRRRPTPPQRRRTRWSGTSSPGSSSRAPRCRVGRTKSCSRRARARRGYRHVVHR